MKAKGCNCGSTNMLHDPNCRFTDYVGENAGHRFQTCKFGCGALIQTGSDECRRSLCPKEYVGAARPE